MHLTNFLLTRNRNYATAQIYDDQRLVARAMVYGKAPINEVAHTRYPGDKVVFHRSTKVRLVVCGCILELR